MVKFRATIFASLVLLAGCATTPVPLSQAKAVPTKRILAGYADFDTPTSGNVKVTFVRDKGILGSAAPALLSIDGVAVAKLRTSEELVVYLKPGVHIFAVAQSPRVMGAIVEKSFDITQDNPRYFRISINQTAFTIQPSARLR